MTLLDIKNYINFVKYSRIVLPNLFIYPTIYLQEEKKALEGTDRSTK